MLHSGASATDTMRSRKTLLGDDIVCRYFALQSYVLNKQLLLLTAPFIADTTLLMLTAPFIADTTLLMLTAPFIADTTLLMLLPSLVHETSCFRGVFYFGASGKRPVSHEYSIKGWS